MLKRAPEAIAKKCSNCMLCEGQQKIDIPSEPSNLSFVRDKLRSIGEYCELDDTAIFDMQVAVGEAAANAIEHGSPKGSENQVEIVFTCDGTCLVISVKDEGRFNKRMPAIDTEISFRGRGIPLMLALMDAVTIDEARNGTSVVLMKKII